MLKFLVVCLIAATVSAADHAEVSKRIRDNDLTWLKGESYDGATAWAIVGLTEADSF